MTSKPTDTKSKLIATATELIWRNSYHAVSVDGICAEAGVKKGSFYHFFPSKSDLALATIDAGLEHIKTDYDDIFSPARPASERFDRLVDHLIEMQQEKLALHGYVCGCPLATLGSELAPEDGAVGHRVRAICDVKISYYENALRDLAADGLIDTQTDITRKANDIMAFIVGLSVMARIRNDLERLRTDMKGSLTELIGLCRTDTETTNRKAS